MKHISPTQTGFKYVYITRIDSDDLFHRTAFEEIQKQPFKERGALIYFKGFLLSHSHREPSIWRRIRWGIGRRLTELREKYDI